MPAFSTNLTFPIVTIFIPCFRILLKIYEQLATETNKERVQLCCVVLEGGPGTLETVYQAIQNNTPVVIFNKTGRIADLLSDVYNKTDMYDNLKIIKFLL